MRAEHKTARELAEQYLSLARLMDKPALLLYAHMALGSTLYHLGEFASARERLEQGIALYDSQKRRLNVFRVADDPGVICLFCTALALWFLGYPDQALKRVHEALTQAQKLSHPHSLAHTLAFAALLHQYRREGQATQERAEAAIALSTEHGFPLHLAAGTIQRGWTLAEQGQEEEGIAQMRQGIATHQATGAEADGRASLPRWPGHTGKWAEQKKD